MSSSSSLSSVAISISVTGSISSVIRQSRRCLTHVELTRDHVGDQAGAVFAEEGDFALSASEASV